MVPMCPLFGGFTVHVFFSVSAVTRAALAERTAHAAHTPLRFVRRLLLYSYRRIQQRWTPGWNKLVKASKEHADFWYNVWVETGSPQGL